MIVSDEKEKTSFLNPVNDNDSGNSDRVKVQTLCQHRSVILATWIVCSMTNRIVHSPLCALMFGCGCAPLWAGGWRHCNVHRPNMSLPRCPWCTMWSRKDAIGLIYKGVIFDSAPDQDGLTVIAMTAAFWYTFQHLQRTVGRRYAIVPSVVVSLGSGLLSCALVGLVWGSFSQYPYWFGIGNVTAVQWDSRNATGSDSSGLSLIGSILLGTLGGMFWSCILVGIGFLSWRYVMK
jgi:hypothetical protein